MKFDRCKYLYIDIFGHPYCQARQGTRKICEHCRFSDEYSKARKFHEKLKDRLEIVSNKSKKVKSTIPLKFKDKIEKDVHLVIGKKVYSGGHACFQLSAMRFPCLESISLIAIPFFRVGYVVLKRIKQYL